MSEHDDFAGEPDVYPDEPDFDAEPAPDVVPMLTELVRALVDHPDEVEISREQQGASVDLAVRVDPDDLGHVIGRQGRTVRALRALLEARGVEEGRSYELEIVRS